MDFCAYISGSRETTRSLYRKAFDEKRTPISKLDNVLVSDQFWSSTSFGHIVFKMFVA